VLDLLYDVNESAQMPGARRIELSMPEKCDRREEIDLAGVPDAGYRSPPPRGLVPARTSLAQLMTDVPHLAYADFAAKYPQLARSIEPAEGEAIPLAFLTPDEIDDYLYELDMKLNPRSPYPTLAPLARDDKGAAAAGWRRGSASAASNAGVIGGPGGSTANPAERDFALKNPASVYNWLRKHAPNTFLQDGEGGGGGGGDATAGGGGGGGGGRRGSKGGTGAVRPTSSSSSSKKRGSKSEHWDDGGEGDGGVAVTPGRGKRKRSSDEDQRPRSRSSIGGSGGGYLGSAAATAAAARPVKKKRRSDGEATPGWR
jgi:hypothetical protein